MPTLPKFRMRPDTQAYAVDGGTEVVSSKLDGGLGNYRRGKLGASSTVTVQYTCDPLEYEYTRAFYRTTLQMGSAPFLADMIFDGPGFLCYKCWFIPDTGFKLLSRVGEASVVGAQLEIIPVTNVDPAFDTAVVLVFGLYGDRAGLQLDAFNNIVNNIYSQIG